MRKAAQLLGRSSRAQEPTQCAAEVERSTTERLRKGKGGGQGWMRRPPSSLGLVAAAPAAIGARQVEPSTAAGIENRQKKEAAGSWNRQPPVLRMVITPRLRGARQAEL